MAKKTRQEITASNRWHKFVFSFFAALYWGAILGGHWHRFKYRHEVPEKKLGSPLAWMAYSLIVCGIVFAATLVWLRPKFLQGANFNFDVQNLIFIIVTTYVLQFIFAIGVVTDESLQFARTIAFFGPLIAAARVVIVVLLTLQFQTATNVMIVTSEGMSEMPLVLIIPSSIFMLEYFCAGISIVALRFKKPSQM